MFTFTNLNKYGRLGNQLFQIAATIQLARKHGVGYVLPEWPYAKYFEYLPLNPLKGTLPEQDKIDFHEAHHHYADYTLEVGKVVDIHGYFQSEKFLPEDVRSLFRFKQNFYLNILKDCLLQYDKKNCCIHIRRGDYVNNPNYVNLPLDYYYRAIELVDDDFELLVFSDDIKWCKEHFKPARKAVFIEGNSEIEDLALMSLCDSHVISNSTFAWWGAYLSGSNFVIAPDKWYAGELAKTHSEKDVVPESWIKIPSFAPPEKIDLLDVTFTIPVKFDHEDRLQNLDLCIRFLQTHFKTNIIVCEMDTEQKFKSVSFPDGYKYHFIANGTFHRTKMLNEMAKMATTPFVANWDADVLIDPQQILKAVKALRDGMVSGVYPYDGKFFRVDRKHYEETLQTLSVEHFKKLTFPPIQHQQISVGGAIIWNKEDFIKGGMENENFVSYGPEDYERFERFKKLGFVIGRIHGPLYHINHYIGPDSCDKHEHFQKNVNEHEKICSMIKPEIEEYISTWNWLPPSPLKGEVAKNKVQKDFIGEKSPLGDLGVKKTKSRKQGVNKQPHDSTELNPLLTLNFDKIYVVNLKRRPERLEHAKKELALAKIPNFEVMPAVDGTELKLSIPSIPRLTPGMIGCFETHVNIISKAFFKGFDTICVFEDDVVFAPGFSEFMEEAIKALPEDWEFCYLGCTEYGGLGDHKQKINDYWVVPKCVWGTQGYMIRGKKALKTLFHGLKRKEMQIDEQLANLVLPSSGLKYYALYPTNMVSQADREVFESDVQIN